MKPVDARALFGVRFNNLFGIRCRSERTVMHHQEDDLTPWFDGRTKPARPGVYMLESGGARRALGFQHWNGESWGSWHETVAQAARRGDMERADRFYQDDRWRGLKKMPNAKLSGPPVDNRSDDGQPD